MQSPIYPPPVILLADDDESLRRLVHATIPPDEFEVLEASDGNEALRLARARHPGVVLLDIAMPARNGFEVCAELKGDPATADIKVLMLTGLHAEVDRKRASQVGADGYLTKPFSPRELLDTILNLLR